MVGIVFIDAYDNAWYKFINIRETALEEEQVSEQQATDRINSADTIVYRVIN